MDDKPSLKEAWSDNVNHINFWGTNHISETVEARVVKLCTQVNRNKKYYLTVTLSTLLISGTDHGVIHAVVMPARLIADFVVNDRQHYLL